MDKYDYEAAVRKDVMEYLEENWNGRIEDEDRGGLLDDMRNCDSVTGNASGSHTMNTWKAEENVCHNFDLLHEAIEDFGMDFDFDAGAEAWDVTIRCWMLDRVLDSVVEEWNESHPAAEDEEDAE